MSGGDAWSAGVLLSCNASTGVWRLLEVVITWRMLSVSRGHHTQHTGHLYQDHQGGSCLAVSNSLGPHGPWPTRLLCPWYSPGKNTGVGCHFLLQGIFPTHVIHPHCILTYSVESTLLRPDSAILITSLAVFLQTDKSHNLGGNCISRHIISLSPRLGSTTC